MQFFGSAFGRTSLLRRGRSMPDRYAWTTLNRSTLYVIEQLRVFKNIKHRHLHCFTLYKFLPFGRSDLWYGRLIEDRTHGTGHI